MLHAKYQGSRPCGFRQEFFRIFPLQAYINMLTIPLGGTI